MHRAGKPSIDDCATSRQGHRGSHPQCRSPQPIFVI